MKSADDRDSVRVYRARHVRQWHVAFHPREVSSLFDELIHRRWGRARWQPKVNILRIASGYVVEVDIPGVDEDSIEVGIRGQYLTVEGNRETGRTDSRVGILVCERPDGPFSRVMKFAETIENFRLQKSLNRGVLTLILTKA
jgi:HSP20 family protein